MAAPITNASALNNKTILREAAAEYINGNQFRPFMGEAPTNIVQTVMNTEKGAGDTIHVPFLDALDPAAARTGAQQVEGNEEDLVFASDSVTVDYVRHATKVELHKLVDVRTPIRVLEQLRPMLTDVAAQRLRNDIIDACGVTASPNRTRALFGAVDTNYNAALATALQNVDNTADKLSVGMIRLAKAKAQNIASVSLGVVSRKIRPFKMKMANGAVSQMYVMFVDSVAAIHLKNDADFKDLRDDNRTNELSTPYFDGSKYLGMVDGVLVYEIEELTRIESPTGGASSTRVAHNLLCGAQAVAVGVANLGYFAEETMDYQHHKGVCYAIIRGTKMLQWNGVETGVVHVWSHGAL
ncbi:MAG: DUF4043 family protein [Burkholderiaceae bacterium]